MHSSKIDLNLESAANNFSALVEWLSRWEHLASCHPIQVANGLIATSPDLDHWWNIEWRRAIDYYYSSSGLSSGLSSTQQKELEESIPSSLANYIRTAANLPLPRSPSYGIPSNDPPHIHGVTPKKIHEVSTLTRFISEQIGSQANGSKPWIVDVGAGQGYVSRALAAAPHHYNVLALDGNPLQTEGALRRDDGLLRQNLKKKQKAPNPLTSEPGSLTHKTTHINDPAQIASAISEWVLELRKDDEPVSIIIIALHACGDLTPAILKHVATQTNHDWKVVRAVIVGCCYNLLSQHSFPMSEKGLAVIKHNQDLDLTLQHRHLATQSPLTWELGDDPNSGASLAVRKVVYRALLGRRLPISHKDYTGVKLSNVNWNEKRTGRLPDSVYSSFNQYLSVAGQKLQLHPGDFDAGSPMTPEETSLYGKLELLYTLRCFMGPVVESAIVLDRVIYLMEKLEEPGVQLWNLFDQTTGSLRNLALVWQPDQSS